MAIGASIIKHFPDQVRTRLISQLINGIWVGVLQKFLKYLNGNQILTFFVLLFPILPVIFVLNLNEAMLLLSKGKPAIVPTLFKNGSSLYYHHKLPDVL